VKPGKRFDKKLRVWPGFIDGFPESFHRTFRETHRESQHSTMRIMFSGGGTGGGVYPAIAVASALRAQRPDASFLWLGSTRGPEKDLVERAGLPFTGVAGGPVVGVGLRAVPNAARLLAGTVQALGVVRRFAPRALLITGGWATIPAALACWLRRVPVIIYMPDVEPGSTIQALSRIAHRVAVTAADSVALFAPGKAVETGYPLRSDVLAAAGFDPSGQPLTTPPPSRVTARERFGLLPGLPTLLVSGGSRGARSINQALTGGLPDLLGPEEAPVCQIIHISGQLDRARVEEQVARLAETAPEPVANRYHAYEYLHGEDMALALAAADLVVSRAGASTLGEFPLFALPAILVPYPHAWRYQKTNADYLVSRGAAQRLDDERLASDLAPLVKQVLADQARRAAMSDAAGRLRRPDAAARIAALLIEAAERRAARQP
jgi:UDP-N-acetylglucosamine--N-acetylmuramyl-(pentapeptide) pyrophosphoryl-undecaprenol N-acetylglucosamine transferase